MDHGKFIYRAGGGSSLARFDPGFTGEFADEARARARLEEDTADLARLQDLLMAHGAYGLLVLFQAMDGAGKDATIKHVMSSVDPQGCEVKLFKRETPKEAKHDYLWRAAQAVPALGQIGIFNRSYYEHVVGERLHPENLEEQQLPEEVRGDDIWEKRYRQINNFEQYLVENGIHVLKFYLNLSRDEQRRRLLERIERPEKRWKFSSNDINERERWDEYMKVYEETFERTSTDWAPWHIIPADNRWFARAAVASVIVAKLASFHTDYPRLGEEREKELKEAREKLEAEKGGGGRAGAATPLS